MSLYYNAWKEVEEKNYFLNFFLSGRGTGKSYSILHGLVKKALEENKLFIYLRRTDKELIKSTSSQLNEFQVVSEDFEINIECNKTDDMTLIQVIEDDTVKTIGVAGTLSTFANMRGLSFRDFDYLFYDEFISKNKVQTIVDKNAGMLFKDLTETILRNRQIDENGNILENSFKIILCGNSNNLNNDILETWKLIDIFRQMQINNIDDYYIEERSIALHLPHNVGISKLKKQTALYKSLPEDDEYIQMSINNKFVDDDFSFIKHYQQKHLVPIFSIENKIFIYSIKGTKMIYVSDRKNKDSINYDKLTALKSDYGMMLNFWFSKKLIRYQNYSIKVKFNNLF